MAGTTFMQTLVNKLIIKNAGIFLTIVLINLVTSGFLILRPVLVSIIVDQGIASGSFNDFVIFTAIFVIIIITGFILDFFGFKLYRLFTKRIIGVVKYEILKNLIIFAENKLLDINNDGELKSRLDDHYNIYDFIDLITIDFPINFVTLVGYIVYCFLIQPTFALILLLLLPLFFIKSLIFSKKLQVTEAAGFQSYQEEESNLLNIINNRQHIYINHKFSFLKKLFNRSFEKRYTLTNAHLFLVKLSEIVDGIFQFVIIVVVLFVGYETISRNINTIGQWSSLFYIAQTLIPLVMAVVGIVEKVAVYSNARKRLNEVFANKKILNNAITLPVSIKNQNISYDSTLLANIEIIIEKNKIYYCVGNSGSGKTTLMKKIIGIRYKKDDQDCDTIILPSNVLYLNAQVPLFHDTLLYNVQFDDNVENLKEILSVLGIHKRIEQLPNQFDEVIKNDGNTFSDGEKQRINLIRAFDPGIELLILDEATSCLDINAERNFLTKLFETKWNKTIIVITHRLTMIEESDFVIFINKGLVTQSTHRELLQNESYNYIYSRAQQK